MFKVDTHIFLAQLHGSIAVGVGHLSLLAQTTSDITMNKAQDGNGAESDANDGAGSC